MLDRTESSQQSEQVCEDDVPATGLLRFAMLAPFATRSFRYQWPADLLTSWAFEMETLTLGWYVMTQTGSVLMLTVFGSLQFLGTLAAPGFGVLADRLGALDPDVICAFGGDRLDYLHVIEGERQWS